MKLSQLLSGRFRTEKGATDPLLLLASLSITLVLLVGGSFAVSGIIANAHRVNAKSDLDKVAVAEAGAYADSSAFMAYDSKTSGATSLEQSSLGFTPTTGANAHLVVVRNTKGSDGWAAISRADTSGKELYIRTSQSSAQATADPKTGALLEPTSPEGKTVGDALSALGVTTSELFTAVSK